MQAALITALEPLIRAAAGIVAVLLTFRSVVPAIAAWASAANPKLKAEAAHHAFDVGIGVAILVGFAVWFPALRSLLGL